MHIALLATFCATLPLLLVGACSDSEPAGVAPDAPPPPPDAPAGCDPATVLPTSYRPIPMVSAGAVSVHGDAERREGTLDATAGGTANAADRPYLYVDLEAGVRVDVSDLDARTSSAWDIALKRSSLRVNGGDSGPGNRTLAVVAAASLDEVTAAPATGYLADDFTTADCMLDSIPGGEPRSAFGEWYAYDTQTHAVSPKPEVYVLERADGSRTALRIVTYYGDATMPMRGAFYQVEWKRLP